MASNRIKKTTAGVAAAIIAVAATISATSVKADAALIYRTKTISIHDKEEISYMLDLIDNQRQFKNSAGHSTRHMVEYLLYDSDYAVFGGKAFPVANTYGSSAGSIRDSGLCSIYGTDVMPLDSFSRGCMAYSWFASGTVYGSNYSLKSTRWYVPGDAGSYTVDQMRNFCKSNLQAGEHLRVNWLHSMTFISCDSDGIYYLEYPTSDDRDPYIKLSYSDWNTFTKRINNDNATMWVYEVHNDHVDGQNSRSIVSNYHYAPAGDKTGAYTAYATLSCVNGKYTTPTDLMSKNISATELDKDIGGTKYMLKGNMVTKMINLISVMVANPDKTAVIKIAANNKYPERYLVYTGIDEDGTAMLIDPLTDNAAKPYTDVFGSIPNAFARAEYITAR